MALSISTLLVLAFVDSYFVIVLASIDTVTITETTTTVNWTTPTEVTSENITGYTLTYDSTTININSSLVTSYHVTGLSSGTLYSVCYVINMSDGSTGDESCVSFYTTYDPLNIYAVIALGISGGILVMLLIAKGLEFVIDPDKVLEGEYKNAKQRQLELKHRGNKVDLMDDNSNEPKTFEEETTINEELKRADLV
ncbi:uncharacterized protein LOC144355883 [Saccoglossus kowalevskii]